MRKIFGVYRLGPTGNSSSLASVCRPCETLSSVPLFSKNEYQKRYDPSRVNSLAFMLTAHRTSISSFGRGFDSHRPLHESQVGSRCFSALAVCKQTKPFQRIQHTHLSGLGEAPVRSVRASSAM